MYVGMCVVRKYEARVDDMVCGLKLFLLSTLGWAVQLDCDNFNLFYYKSLFFALISLF